MQIIKINFRKVMILLIFEKSSWLKSAGTWKTQILEKHRYFKSKDTWKYLKNIYIRVVLKLVLILSRQTCNTIYRNFDKSCVFCHALPFQRAPEDVCMSNGSQVTAGFVKTIACTIIPLPPRKEGKNEQKHKFIHLFHPSLCANCEIDQNCDPNVARMYTVLNQSKHF